VNAEGFKHWNQHHGSYLFFSLVVFIRLSEIKRHDLRYFVSVLIKGLKSKMVSLRTALLLDRKRRKHGHKHGERVRAVRGRPALAPCVDTWSSSSFAQSLHQNYRLRRICS
jgi:hypothetical protein